MTDQPKSTRASRQLLVVRSVAWMSLALSVVAASGGCSRMRAQLPVDEHPLFLRDARTQAPIGQVLVLPMYETSTGYSTGGGHGPGYMRDSPFAANPFLYDSGALFTPEQPSSNGVVLGPPGSFFAGKGVTNKGVVIIARDHRARWFGDLWDRKSPFVDLEPLSMSEAAAHRARIAAILRGGKIDGRTLTDEELRVFNCLIDSVVHLHFTDHDRRRIAEFLRD